MSRRLDTPDRHPGNLHRLAVPEKYVRLHSLRVMVLRGQIGIGIMNQFFLPIADIDPCTGQLCKLLDASDVVKMRMGQKNPLDFKSKLPRFVRKCLSVIRRIHQYSLLCPFPIKEVHICLYHSDHVSLHNNLRCHRIVLSL